MIIWTHSEKVSHNYYNKWVKLIRSWEQYLKLNRIVKKLWIHLKMKYSGKSLT